MLLNRLARWLRRAGGRVGLPGLLSAAQDPDGTETTEAARMASRDLTALRADVRPLVERLIRGLDPGLPDTERYQIAEALSGAVYPKYKFSEHGRIFLEDHEFVSAYERFMDTGNWHSLDRKYTLAQLLKLTLDLPGDVAECGVYKGGSAWLMCEAVRAHGKVVHLFDSFEGLSEPGEADGAYWSRGGLRVEESVVRENLKEFDNVAFHRGWFPEPFAEVAGKRFAFVHVDVDLFEPTRDCLSFFYPRVVTGGVLLFDDYGFTTCPGARAAVDSFFADKPEPIVMLPTGQAFVIKRDPALKSPLP